jgi:hypothetical protein
MVPLDLSRFSNQSKSATIRSGRLDQCRSFRESTPFFVVRSILNVDTTADPALNFFLQLITRTYDIMVETILSGWIHFVESGVTTTKYCSSFFLLRSTSLQMNDTYSKYYSTVVLLIFVLVVSLRTSFGIIITNHRLQYKEQKKPSDSIYCVQTTVIQNHK